MALSNKLHCKKNTGTWSQLFPLQLSQFVIRNNDVKVYIFVMCDDVTKLNICIHASKKPQAL